MEDTTIEAVLKTVEKLYGEKAYSEALVLLEKSSKDISQGLWHYNMGSVLAKLDRLPEARYHFLMSDRAGFYSKELSQNQEIVESKLGLTKVENPLTFSDHFYRSALVGSEGYFTTLALLFLVLSVWILRKKDQIKIAMFYFVVSVSLIAMNLWVQSLDQYVVVNQKIIHDGPSMIFGERGELPLGIKLITEKNEEWIKIIYPSRYAGWIKKSELKELK